MRSHLDGFVALTRDLIASDLGFDRREAVCQNESNTSTKVYEQ